MPSPHNFDSDVDYWEACNPDEAAYDSLMGSDEASNRFIKRNIASANEALWNKTDLMLPACFLLNRVSDEYNPVALKSWNFLVNLSGDKEEEICTWNTEAALIVLLFADISNFPERYRQAFKNHRSALFGAISEKRLLLVEFVSEREEEKYNI